MGRLGKVLKQKNHSLDHGKKLMKNSAKVHKSLHHAAESCGDETGSTADLRT